MFSVENPISDLISLVNKLRNNKTNMWFFYTFTNRDTDIKSSSLREEIGRDISEVGLFKDACVKKMAGNQYLQFNSTNCYNFQEWQNGVHYNYFSL